MKANNSLLYFVSDVWGEVNQLLSGKSHFEVNLLEFSKKICRGNLSISYCRLLDQRKLPGSEEYVCCSTPEQVFHSLSFNTSVHLYHQDLIWPMDWSCIPSYHCTGGRGDQMYGSKGRSCHRDHCSIWTRYCSGFLIMDVDLIGWWSLIMIIWFGESKIFPRYNSINW